MIIDASVVVKWFSPEEQADEARRLIVATEPLLAPDLLVAEAGNAMWSKTRRGEMDLAGAMEAIQVITAGRDLELHPSAPLVPRAFELARETDTRCTTASTSRSPNHSTSLS